MNRGAVARLLGLVVLIMLLVAALLTPVPARADRVAVPAPVMLRLQHSSMLYTDTPAEKRHDARLVFTTGADMISFTEVGTKQNAIGQRYLRASARAAGYRIWFPGFEGGIAVRRGVGRIVAHGYFGPILPGVARDHPSIGLAWVTVDVPGAGLVTYGVTHAMTGDFVAARHALNDDLASEVARVEKKKAAGPALTFFAEDANRNDAHQDLMPGLPFTTCWDELGYHPHTRDSRTIDVVGSYDHDGRVSAHSARVLRLGLFTDHRSILATYAVAPLRKD